jgi:hypothetical protein
LGKVVILSMAFLLQKSSYDRDRGATDDVAEVNAAGGAVM